MTSAAAVPTWVVVTGSLHNRGGMDAANLALVQYLLDRNVRVHVVAHEIDVSVSRHPAARCHRVPKSLGSFFISEFILAAFGRAVAASVTRTCPEARVVVNGGNCGWPDINWVHFVHSAWQSPAARAPRWFKLKNAVSQRIARRREKSAIRGAMFVVANSVATRRHLVEMLDVPEHRIKVVYLESPVGARPVVAEERLAARAWLGIPPSATVLSFVGALGYDARKGFDTLLNAWQAWQSASPDEAYLVVAGGGRGLSDWKRRASGLQARGRIMFLGMTHRVADVLAASDLLVSPARYEAYGLNVHEAVCRGVPAIVSAHAGVAEQFPPEFSAMLLPDAENAADLAQRLSAWFQDQAGWRERFEQLGERLRSRTCEDMCREFVAAAGGLALVDGQ